MIENKILNVIRKGCRLICHQKTDRCFKYKSFIFPICARCTGIIISFILSLFLLINKIYLNRQLVVIMIVIMFLDWFFQFLKIKESTNTRRFITGLIGGFGLSYFYYYLINLIINHILQI